MRSGAAAERSNPTCKERQLHGHRAAKRSYSMLKVRRGGHEEIPLIQGKEQWLHFAGYMEPSIFVAACEPLVMACGI